MMESSSIPRIWVDTGLKSPYRVYPIPVLTFTIVNQLAGANVWISIIVGVILTTKYPYYAKKRGQA